MNEYKIETTTQYDKDFERLDYSVRIQIEQEIEQLKINPFVGKPLGYKFFREKKVGKFRFYFLIYEEYVVVFVIALSDKKNQQETINIIKQLIPHYKEEIKNRIKQK